VYLGFRSVYSTYQLIVPWGYATKLSFDFHQRFVNLIQPEFHDFRSSSKLMLHETASGHFFFHYDEFS
jgi:hypothetical protein